MNEFHLQVCVAKTVVSDVQGSPLDTAGTLKSHRCEESHPLGRHDALEKGRIIQLVQSLIIHLLAPVGWQWSSLRPFFC